MRKLSTHRRVVLLLAGGAILTAGCLAPAALSHTHLARRARQPGAATTAAGGHLEGTLTLSEDWSGQDDETTPCEGGGRDGDLYAWQDHWTGRLTADVTIGMDGQQDNRSHSSFAGSYSFTHDQPDCGFDPVTAHSAGSYQGTGDGAGALQVSRDGQSLAIGAQFPATGSGTNDCRGTPPPSDGWFGWPLGIDIPPPGRSVSVHVDEPITALGDFDCVMVGGPDAADKAHLTGTLTFTSGPGMRAKLKQPAATMRGEKVTLDASPSTPSSGIKHYEFHFKPGPDCPDHTQLAATQKPGDNGGRTPTTKVRLLCSLRVAVTVADKDGNEDTSVPVLAEVSPRKFEKVPFHQDPTIQKANLPFGGHVLTYAFGMNRDSKDWRRSHDADKTDHWLSPFPDRTNAKGSLKLKQVDDPRGPFDRFWYVGSHNLKVNRVAILNRKLLPGGDVFDENDSRALQSGLALIVKATERHERLHGELVQACLGEDKFRLVTELEKLMAPSTKSLLGRSNSLISEAETQLKQASSEEKVHARMREIFGDQKATIVQDGPDGLPQRHTYVLATLGDSEREGGH